MTTAHSRRYDEEQDMHKQTTFLEGETSTQDDKIRSARTSAAVAVWLLQ